MSRFYFSEKLDFLVGQCFNKVVHLLQHTSKGLQENVEIVIVLIYWFIFKSKMCV